MSDKTYKGQCYCGAVTIEVVGEPEGAVLAPDFSGKPRQIAIGRQLSLGDRYNDCVDISHDSSVR